MKKIFVDVDGVLANYNAAREANPCNETDWWNDVLPNTPHFFDKLPLITNAHDFWDALRSLAEPFQLEFLTAAPENRQGCLYTAAYDKQNWLRRHFGEHYVSHTVMGAKNKTHYCKAGDILIDDTLANCLDWESAGGIAIHHNDYESTLLEVKDLIEYKLEEAMPYIHTKELELRELPFIDLKTLKAAYKLLSKAKYQGRPYYVVQNTANHGYLSGYVEGNKFIPSIRIITKKPDKHWLGHNTPTQLNNEWQQVAMVDADINNALRGMGRFTYNTIAKHNDLVSDREQYPAAKALWLSLARDGQINVYVWDGTEDVQDYVRDSQGKPIKFDSTNIDHDTIWGPKKAHSKRLLVATSRELE